MKQHERERRKEEERKAMIIDRQEGTNLRGKGG